tara:strand:- start:109 stop:270 length:162 start_codon:yes stop_codon:yes gene_type:complete
MINEKEVSDAMSHFLRITEGRELTKETEDALETFRRFQAYFDDDPCGLVFYQP